MAVRGLIEELRIVYPEKKLVISTVTATGNKIARAIAKEGDFVTYLPLDASFIVKRVINKINPSIFIIAETEIWPNLISCLYRRKIPIIAVNGRISDRSFRGYLAIRFLIRPILKKINLFCVQTEPDAERLMYLGVLPGKIQITGNMKFDIKDYDFKKNYAQCRARLNLGPQEKLLVAASTHPGEERIVLIAYKALLKEFPDLRLLIAPRHPERSSNIVDLIKKYDFEPVKISLLESRTRGLKNLRTIFILDTIGELISFYAIADIVFVGGSLVKKGGHNILEPASQEKPILFGPHMFNFRDIAELFLNNKAALMVHSQKELEANITDLLNNPDKARELGKTALGLIRKNQGATRRNIESILACI